MNKKIIILIIAEIIILLLISTPFGFIGGWFGNAEQVAKKEFYPDALLKKYEWFKDASAQLDSKVATIKILEKRIETIEETYGETPRQSWARSDREQYNVWLNENAGVKASYNTLAAEYNSQMVKFNWRFTNVGDLPPGSTTPLPREYKPYIKE